MPVIRSFRRTACVLASLLLGACSTVGQGFDPAGVSALVPGQSTLADARVLLKAPPTQTYAATNGALQALWYGGVRGPVDTHASRSVLLAFGADGRFRQVVDARNVFLDDSAASRQREQLACRERALNWPCTGERTEPELSVPVPVASEAVRADAVPAEVVQPTVPPTGCYAAGDKVTICPTL